MSDHVDQLKGEAMEHARWAAESNGHTGLSDAELLALIDETYPGGVAAYDKETREEGWR